MTRIDTLLVVAAHPDDEVLGCGGLMSRVSRGGGRVVVLILTEGSSTQYPNRPDLVEAKRQHAVRAVGSLGGTVEFAQLPDMALSTLAPADVNRPIEKAISTHRPTWVAVHHGGDLNRDHQIAHEAARVACRPGTDAPTRLIAYETLSSTEWGSVAFEPDLFIALQESDLASKVAAFRTYETEIRAWPHPRSPEAIEHLAAVRGSHSGRHLAEAFQTVWESW